MFQTHTPVSQTDFFDRRGELDRLAEIVRRLETGAGVTWLALLGQRKVGKTSLLLEARRRTGARFVMIDLFERTPVDLEVFRTYALRALDAVAAVEAGRSFEAAARGEGYAALVARSPTLLGLPADVRDVVFSLPTLDLDAAGVAVCLDLPEQLARAANTPMVAAWDEFQELPVTSGRHGFDVLATMRSVWQRHRRVAYVISGSEPTVLRELATAKRSPFFQHFDLMELGPMSDEDGVKLVVEASEGAVSGEVARRLVGVVGGHPFYLQVLGDELVRGGTPFDDAAVKDTLQKTLFSRAGRLGLYFERVYGELVGQSTHLAAVVRALAVSAAGLRLGELAKAIGAPSGDTARYVERLGDAVFRDEERRYRVRDRAFALWVAWREPSGTVVPMSVVGDAAERETAEALAAMGFDLVYQSRASRGAFDLLATRGASQLGVQVKRKRLPLAFGLAEWRRMEAEGKRFGWRWVVAAVHEGEVRFLDPAKARVGRTARLTADATIANVLGWLDDLSPPGGSDREGPASRR
jgi:Holliday junction resolvase